MLCELESGDGFWKINFLVLLMKRIEVFKSTTVVMVTNKHAAWIQIYT
jgi:hypothetical protein